MRNVIVVWSLLLAACADAPGRAAQLADLEEEEVGRRWRVVFDPDAARLTSAAKERAAPAQGGAFSAEDVPAAARAFLARHPVAFGERAGEDVVLRDLIVDPLGGARVRFEQRVAGLPVDGGDVVVVLDGAGRARGVSGTFLHARELGAGPVIDAAAAARAAREALLTVWPPGELVEAAPPELVVVATGDRLRPAWRITLAGEDPARSPPVVRRELLIDAAGGELLAHREALVAARVRGSGIGVDGQRKPLELVHESDGRFVMKNETILAAGIRTFTARGGERLPGLLVRSDDVDAWDEDGPAAGAAVDAHAHAAIVQRYLFERLGRRALDHDDGAIRVVTHYSRDLANAFWDGERVVLGDGDGDGFLPLGASLDIVAHEMFHGVTQHDSGLVYALQPGALNESLSDVFAVFVELREGDGDWLIGEDVTWPPLRDLAAPHRVGLPAHMREYVDLPPTPEADMGGVHVNSSIPSHAAYLAVRRLDVERVERIWYRAAHMYLAPRASFADFAEATRSAAEDLHGPGAEEVEAIEASWREVGVW